MLIDAVLASGDRQALLGATRFDAAQFVGDADFSNVRFTREAGFEQAAFLGAARFVASEFEGEASFERARLSRAQFREASFDSNAWFGEAVFIDDARFDDARFGGSVRFRGTRFGGNAAFDGAHFSGNAGFHGAHFTGCAWFDGARFENASQLGPLVCGEAVDLSSVTFAAPVVIEAAARRIWCIRTEWASRATLRLRYATMDLSDAILAHPLSVAARPTPFTDGAGSEGTGQALEEQALSGRDAGVRIASLRGVDVAQLVLHDVDLTVCLFSSAVHLDQLRLEGGYLLALPPAGLHRSGLLPVRWTTRRTLAEEQHWRAAKGWKTWTPAPNGVDVVGPTGLAALYRQLRKSFEDGRNEPDAGDFYYGEMEMRRHDTKRPGAERALLTVYWAVSGYGLRASRAMGWLLGAVVATVLVMMLWGVPKASVKTESSGRLMGQSFSLTSDATDPVAPDGPLGLRVTSERFEKSMRVVINSVVFRSSSQDLTTVGTYTEMLSRVVEPALLGLAVLAARGRVKR